MAKSKTQKETKVYTNLHGPKGKKLYVGKKRLSTGKIKYLYSKQKTGVTGGVGKSSQKSAIPSARKDK